MSKHMHHFTVTIGREYGSGGSLIAKQLAQALSIPFYDKKLIEIAAKETGLSEAFIREAEQRRTSSFLYNLSFSSRNLPVSDQVFIAESNVIRRVAAEGPCVIVGRCANYVLRDQPNCLRAFIHAPLADRFQRAKEEYDIPADEVQACVLRHDKARAAYYNYFTTGQWGKCQDYDITLSSALGIDTAAHTLLELIRKKEADL